MRIVSRWSAVDPAGSAGIPPAFFVLLLALLLAACESPQSRGKAHYQRVCVACHGAKGQGVGRLGTPLTTSPVLRQADDEVVAFLKEGRLPNDPANTTGMLMPPRGGDPRLEDDDLRDIVAYVRTLARD